MRKFKIKNRQKRRYVRRKEVYASSHFGKSFAAVLIPPFIIIIAIFSAFLFYNSSPFFHKPEFHISLPSLPAISPEFFYRKLSGIRVPEVSVAPLLKQISDTFVSFIVFFTQAALNVLHFLDPRPLIKIILDTTLAVLIELGRITGTLFWEIVNLVSFITQAVVVGVGNLIIITINLRFWTTMQIYSFLFRVILTILVTIIAAGNRLGDFFYQLVVLIESPFIRLGEDLRVFTPFIDKVSKILSESASTLTSNIGNLF